MEKARVNIIVTGIVQMVGFRYNTVSKASQLDIKGWVRNNRNGSVEIMAEGRREDVEELVKWCHKGPSGAVVKSVDYNWLDYVGDFKDFSINF